MKKGRLAVLKDQRWLTQHRNPAEYMPMADVYSPVLHRVQQQIRYRAVHSDGPIQDVPEILIKYSKPPTELIEAAAKSLKKLQAVADIKPGKISNQYHIPL